MKVLQQLSAKCSCSVCQSGCLCGDCARCSNADLDRSIIKNAKRVSALAFVALIFGGFVYFVPVVSLGATPTLTETFSFKIQQPDSLASPMGSISLCLFGEGAVLSNGTYYPTASLNQTNAQICNPKH